MDNGWIKLHRKVLENEIFMHDPTAWHIFEYLLLRVNHKTGYVDTGRHQISLALDIPGSTTYKALQRLKNAKMVNIKSNNKYSRISICNWSTYQQDSNSPGNNKGTSREQQRNTVQEGKNKELRKKEINKEKEPIQIMTAEQEEVYYANKRRRGVSNEPTNPFR